MVQTRTPAFASEAKATPLPINLPAAREYSRVIVEALPGAAVIVIGSEERVWLADGEMLQREGLDPQRITGRCLRDVLPPSGYSQIRGPYGEAQAGRKQSFDYRPSGSSTVWWVQMSPLPVGHGAPAVMAVVQDVAGREGLTDQLSQERERRLLAEEMASFGHWQVDLEQAQVHLSVGALRLFELGQPGRDRFELTELLELAGPAAAAQTEAALAQAEREGAAEFELVVPLTERGERHVLLRGRAVNADQRRFVSGVAIDVTELRAAERSRETSEAIFLQGFSESPIGMAVTDPDSGRYLKVNAAFCRLLGREVEDVLGLTVAEVTHPEDVAHDDAERGHLRRGERRSLEREKRYVRPDGSLVWASVHVVPILDGRGATHGFFSQVVDRTEQHRREEELRREAADLEGLRELRAALAGDRLRLHGQPIIDLRDGRRVQHELLVRLCREDGVILPPAEFLPLAERYGCMEAIDEWVTRRAVELAALGRPVTVNLSASSVGDERMLSVVREALQDTGADPSLIVFEVTETAVMADLEAGRRFAMALRDLGCRFALDDFGTGYGTLTYLKHIPVDYIKIDIDFVRDLFRSEADERLVRTIVAMAREFAKETIAEGVEDQATLNKLRDLGVDFAQGFHIGRPAPVAAAA